MESQINCQILVLCKVVIYKDEDEHFCHDALLMQVFFLVINKNKGQKLMETTVISILRNMDPIYWTLQRQDMIMKYTAYIDAESNAPCNYNDHRL